jgi:UDP-galactopyranose mutase
MPLKSEQNKARKYFELMPDGVFNVGRAGSYHYSIDIDDSVKQAMNIYNLL